jgi:hypothetical protein
MTPLDIKFPTGSIKDVGDNYSIKINEADIKIDLSLHRLLPPLTIPNNILYKSADETEGFFWNIPLPRASVTGAIEIDGQNIPVDGLCYHDCNWGNLIFKKHFQGWLWTRIFFSEVTFIYWDLFPIDNNAYTRHYFLIDQNGRNFVTSPLNVDYEISSHTNSEYVQIPDKITFQFEDRSHPSITADVLPTSNVAEAPIVSVSNRYLNSLLIKSYYLFRLNRSPNLFRKWFGRLLYSQSTIRAEFHSKDLPIDRSKGNIEVISFAD